MPFPFILGGLLVSTAKPITSQTPSVTIKNLWCRHIRIQWGKKLSPESEVMSLTLPCGWLFIHKCHFHLSSKSVLFLSFCSN